MSVGLSLIMPSYFVKRISTTGSLKAKTPIENTAILFLQAVPRQERGRRGCPIELGCLPAPIRGLVVIFRPLFLLVPSRPLILVLLRQSELASQSESGSPNATGYEVRPSVRPSLVCRLFRVRSFGNRHSPFEQRGQTFHENLHKNVASDIPFLFD